MTQPIGILVNVVGREKRIDLSDGQEASEEMPFRGGSLNVKLLGGAAEISAGQ